MLDQYSADIVCMSESWEKENQPLEELLDLPNYQIITNVKQRNFKGGKPLYCEEIVSRPNYCSNWCGCCVGIGNPKEAIMQ